LVCDLASGGLDLRNILYIREPDARNYSYQEP